MALTVAGSGVFTTDSANTGNVVLQGNLLKVKFPIATDKTQYDYTEIQYQYRLSYQPIYVGGDLSANYVYKDDTDSITTQDWKNLPNSILTATDCTFILQIDTFETDVMITFSVRALDDYSSADTVVFSSSSAVFAIVNRAADISVNSLSWGLNDSVIVTGSIIDTGLSVPANFGSLTTEPLITQWSYWRDGLNTVLKNNNLTNGDISFYYWYQSGKTLPLSSPEQPTVVSGTTSFKLKDVNWFTESGNVISFQIENTGYPTTPKFTSNSSYYFQFDLIAADQNGNTILNQGGTGTQAKLYGSFNTLSPLNYLLSAVPAFQIKKGCVKNNLPKTDTSKTGGGMFSHGQEQGDTGHSIALYDHHVNVGESASANNPSIGFFNDEGTELSCIKYDGQLKVKYPSGTGNIWQSMTINGETKTPAIDGTVDLGTFATVHNISQYTIPRRTGSGSGPTDSYMEYSSQPAADTIARRSSTGILRGADPVEATDLVNKQYFEANASVNSTRIPALTDLNTIETEGMYYCPSTAEATAMPNTAANVAFSLFVEKHAGVKQTFTEYATASPTTWIRNKYQTTWGPWVKQVSTLDILNLVYPVGAVYVSSVSTSPATLFGGTWVSLQDKFLVGAGGLYAAGSTGGAATHTLTANEMPSHTHIQDAHNHSQNAHTHLIDHDYDGAGGSNRYTVHNPGYAAGGVPTSATTATNNAATATNQYTGGGAAHNNLPPYEAFYMWKRTA